MATQVSLNDGAVASAGALAIQTNGTTQAVSISTGQIATLAQNPILTSGTANGVAYLNGSKAVTSGSALVFDATNTALSVGGAALGTAANRTVFTLNGVSSNFLSFGIGGTRVAHFYSDANEFAIANAAGASGFITMQTNGAEKMRLDASGNFGIGTTSPAQKLTVAGNILTANASGTDRYINISTNGVQNTYLGFNNSGSTNTNGVLNNYSYVGNGNAYGLQILANGSVAATFDTSGNLLVGSATSYGGKIQGISTYIRSANGQSSQNVGFVASDFASNEWHFGRSSVDGYYYVVRQTGTGMYMNTNAWVATSDIRAKENIVPLESSLAKINSLNPVRFTFKKDGMADVGFIAQEMYEQIPEVVDKPEDEEAMMGISKEKIIPFLVKAIQEQQSIITTLTARITALESA